MQFVAGSVYINQSSKNNGKLNKLYNLWPEYGKMNNENGSGCDIVKTSETTGWFGVCFKLPRVCLKTPLQEFSDTL